MDLHVFPIPISPPHPIPLGLPSAYFKKMSINGQLFFKNILGTLEGSIKCSIDFETRVKWICQLGFAVSRMRKWAGKWCLC